MFTHSLPLEAACLSNEKSRRDLHSALSAGGLSPDEMEIVEGLAGLCVHYGESKGNGWWTKAVKRELHDLGRSKGYLVYPEKVGKKGDLQHEWLFDLVWLKAKKTKDYLDWRTIRGMPLACESEWLCTEGALLEDFLKLTLALTRTRLFIYQNRPVKTAGGRNHPADLCNKASLSSHGFRYLLIGYPVKSYPADTDGELRIDAWTT